MKRLREEFERPFGERFEEFKKRMEAQEEIKGEKKVVEVVEKKNKPQPKVEKRPPETIMQRTVAQPRVEKRPPSTYTVTD